MREKLLTIFNNYGKNHQTSKLLEEVGEFIETLMNEDKVNMVQEIADVLVIIEQFISFYNLNTSEINEMMKFKINRQMERLKSERSN